MSWLKIEDLDDRMELVTVSDADANWICGGNGGAKSQNYSISYSNGIAGAVRVGNKVYNFSAITDANFNIGKDPSHNVGSATIYITPFKP